jgi:hypothetical protein
LEEAYLKGLQQFEIKKFEIRFLFESSVSFEFFFKELTIEGNHSTRANLAILPISGQGPVKMVFKDVTVRGVFEMNTIDGGYLNLKQIVFSPKVESCDVSISGFGNFIDNAVGALLSASLPELINESSDGINQSVNDRFLPRANKLLNQYRLIDVLLAVIGLSFDSGLTLHAEAV